VIKRSDAGLAPTPLEVLTFMGSINPATQHLGIEVLSAERGRARFAMTVRPDMANTFGSCHGGIIFTLADTAFGWTGNAANEKAVTAAASIDILAPAQVGDRLIADAAETYREGRNILLDVKVWCEGTGVTVAHVRGRLRVIGGPVVPLRG
jgi:acyl-CoA thioesterase